MQCDSRVKGLALAVVVHAGPCRSHVTTDCGWEGEYCTWLLLTHFTPLLCFTLLHTTSLASHSHILKVSQTLHKPQHR